MGTALEWYDYFIYGAAAAIVFGPLFFPNYSAVAGTLAAFATYSVGFFARPLGGVLMGHFGDRIGRKPMLILSILTVGGATFCVGLLPTYATIGVWAPILLVVLRFVQGLGVGGEWSGAVLMATEHAPARRRNLYGSFPQMGVPAGVILANLAFLLVSRSVSPEAFVAWGWRVPFLLSAVLVIGGLIIRRAVTESPEFVAAKSDGKAQAAPLIEVLKTARPQIVLGAGCMIGTGTLGYVLSLYVLSYTTGPLGLERNTILTFTLISAALWMVVTPWASSLADRVGQKRVLLIGGVGLAASTASLFPLLDTRSYPLILIAMLLIATFVAATYGPVAALLADLFESRVRYSGTSLAYQIGTILGGGLAPTVATALFARTGSSFPIGIYLTALTLISLISVALVFRARLTARALTGVVGTSS
ncbi:MFS transporter [Nocardioides sp. NPDC127503]|uniref:MFS transporter n=1 Tax=Nocardioides sp. NPDC127503 TaxID=3154516 RepID=UPI0033331BA5